MTLIECFTASHIDNIAACLRLCPDKMVIVGDATEMAASVERYKKLFKKRNIPVKISTEDVQGKDISDICTVLAKLVRATDECVIDVSGGDEPVILAVGAVLASLDQETLQRIRIEKYDHDENAVLDCINDNRKIPYRAVKLTVEELIDLHNGHLVPDTFQPPADCRPRDLRGLWHIVSREPRDWNRTIMLLNEFESRSDSKMHVYLQSQHQAAISDLAEKEPVIRDFLAELENCGVIEDRSSRYALEYIYSSSMLRYCTKKAGNLLEVKTLLEGRSVLENGAPYFQNCQMSVQIDWNEEDRDADRQSPVTRNEIDVILMHNTTPLFISCKNGNVDEEELYKLHTVAQRFGGPYARKMLIATDLEHKSTAASRSLVQRAWDMDIFLVTDAAELTQDEWRKIFKKAMK